MKSEQDLKKKANLVRKWSLISTSEAGSGHPTSCLSSADLMTVLFDQFFSYDLSNPHNLNNDRLVFSKGHAAPLLYTLYAISGAFPLEDLKTLRRFDSSLEGHPTPNFKYTEAATGSLGQGLSVGAGLAYGIQKESLKSKVQSSKLPKVYVLMGDGELAEGSVWEAANFSSYYNLDNLIAIADINGLGQSQKTMFEHNILEYEYRFKAFGWETVMIDGHNLEEIQEAFKDATSNSTGRPFIIIAKTEKGKGISFLEGKDGWHGKPLKKEELEKALKELGESDDNLKFELKSSIQKTQSIRKPDISNNQMLTNTSLSEFFGKYKLGDQIATREVYGEVLAQMGNINSLIYALDGDTKNSTFSEVFKKAHPDRFIECFIAEQNMIGVALGLSRFGKIPFASTFAAFLTRAFDQIRMSALSSANIKVVGSHSGVSIGEDGASQMGLEDIAMFGTIPNSVIFHPSDAVSTAKIVPLLVSHNGISYLRTLRPKTSVIYDNDEEFKIGGSKILKKSDKDKLTVVAAGITVFEALKAYEELKKKGVLVRVVDCYSIKPIDKKTLQKCLDETEKPILITVEDHFEHGGLGDFVLSALADKGVKVEKMAISHISHSGVKDELLHDGGISSDHIVKKVLSLL